MTKKIALLLVYVCTSSFLYAQTLKITGIVSDSASRKGVEFAQIILYKADRKSIITFSQSKENGSYELQTTATGTPLWLAVRAFGYKSYFAEIPAVSQNSTLTYNATLAEEIAVIQEITVKAKLPGVAIQGDTTTYRADQFKTGTERNVEDLLKKLPGITVTDEGDVYFKGKKVKKMLVEGDNLFDQDYKIGTKNISSNMVDKIQAIENFNDMPHLKGIVDANETVLNLSLKGDKSRPFGEMTLGAGVENRFEGKINAFYLQKRHKTFVLGQANNAGFSPYNINATTQGGAATNNLQSPVPLLIDLPVRLPNAGLSERRTNLNQVGFLNPVYFLKVSEKLTIRLNGQFFSDRNQLFKQNNTTYTLQNAGFNLNENQVSVLRPRLGAGAIYALFVPNNKTRFEYTLVGNLTQRRYANTLIYNVNTEANQNLSENARERSDMLEHRLRYSRKLNDKQAFLANLTYSDFRRSQNHDLLSPRFADFFGADSSQNRFLQTINGKGRQGELALQWIYKKSKFIRYQVKANQQFQNIDFSSQIQLGQGENLSALNNPDFGNQALWQRNSSSLGAGTTFIFSEKTFLSIDLAAKRLYTRYANHNAALWFVEPTIALSTRFKKFASSLSYTFTQQSPLLQNLHQGFILSSYRSFQRGSQELRFLPTQQLSGFASLNDLANYQSLTFFGTYSRSVPFYGSNNSISQNFTISQAQIFPRQEFLLLNLSADKYIHSLLSGFQWFNTFTFSSSDNQANNFQVSNNRFYTLSSKIQYRSVFDGWYNIEASAQWIFSTSRNNLIENNASANNTNLSYVVRQIVQPPSKKWKWIVEAERFEFRSQSKREVYPFLDSEWMIELKKPKMQVSVEVRNLLNNTQIDQLNLTNFAITTSSQRLQSRWALLKVQFKW